MRLFQLVVLVLLATAVKAAVIHNYVGQPLLIDAELDAAPCEITGSLTVATALMGLDPRIRIRTLYSTARNTSWTSIICA
jgi:hypothetical protein